MVLQKKYDIFCLQECDSDSVSYMKKKLKGYVVVEMPNNHLSACGSIILLRSARFPGYDTHKVIGCRENFLKELNRRINKPLIKNKTPKEI